MRHGPHLNLVALVVREYDPAIDFFVRILRFELVEDVPSLTNDGRPKRWVVVRPPGAATGILIAKADGEEQERIVGNQFAGRVGFFLQVDDFSTTYRAHGRGWRHIRETAAYRGLWPGRRFPRSRGQQVGPPRPHAGGLTAALPLHSLPRHRGRVGEGESRPDDL